MLCITARIPAEVISYNTHLKHVHLLLIQLVLQYYYITEAALARSCRLISVAQYLPQYNARAKCKKYFFIQKKTFRKQ